tara:strand:- start:25 stop:636 length:612 start_codon:yes stop_codon:yes gene_type:complete
MIIKLFINIISILLFINLTFAFGNDNQSNRIEVLVDDVIITKYDIIQRIKVNSILKKIEINEKNYDQLLKVVVDDLVIEKLKTQKINEFDINVNKDEFKQNEERFYKSINYTKEDLKKLFLENNINYDYILEIIELELKWQKLIYGLYLRVTSVTEQEVIDLVNKNPNISKEVANDIILQKQLDIKGAKLLNDLRNESTIEYR